MHPFLQLFGREVPTYGLMTLLGVGAGSLFVFGRWHKTSPIFTVDAELAILYGIIGVFFGSKILYLITVLPQLIADLPILFTDPLSFFGVYLSGGFVFYGGFYGGVLACILYCRKNKLDVWEMSRILMPAVPLFHAFGRIGCFFAGCCYGVECERFGVIFTESVAAPNGVPLLPVQLYESAGELILFVFTARLARRRNGGRSAFCFWLIAYGILRYCLEFLRGDAYRGFVGFLSTSQLLALISIGWGLCVWIRGAKRKNAAPASS